MDQKPSVGRIVFYTSGQVYRNNVKEIPAIITEVHGPECVSLTAFPPQELPIVASSIMYGGEAEPATTAWRWPPRV